jgi:hypothetical protein
LAVARAPDFVGVGVQKAGTSWWFRLLCAHPDVDANPEAKELHHFDRFWAQPFGEDDVAAYYACFTAAPDRHTGEWTPRYLYDPWTPPLLAVAAPAARLLVLLRDPIERYRSGLTHSLSYDGLPPAAGTAVDAFARGLYGEQLRRLFLSYPASQVLVLQYERCVDDPRAHLRTTYEFLGLDPDVALPDLRERVLETTAERAPLPSRTAAALRDAYAGDLALLSSLVPSLDLGRWPATRA